MRLSIVAVLWRAPHCVCEIQSAIRPIAPNLLSYHLGILRNAGLISAHRRGRWLDYQLEFGAFEALRASLPTEELHPAGGGDASGRSGPHTGEHDAACHPRARTRA